MNGFLLVVSLALLISISYAAEVCDSRGRSCVKGQADCVNGACVCQAPNSWGDGAFACYKPSTLAAQVFNDPMLTSFNNESVPFPFPCRYLTTHVLNKLKDKGDKNIGTCEFMIHSFNAKFRGKFFLHGFDVALHIRYDSGQSVKLSSRHYGVAKYGVYNFKTQCTAGSFYQNGPFGNDGLFFDDLTNDVHVLVGRHSDNNQLTYKVERCGVRITFVPYDIKDRRAQVSLPGISIAINSDHDPQWLSNTAVMALAPKSQGGALFADIAIPGLSVEESVFARAFTAEYVHNMPMKDKGKCAATHKAFRKCTRPELRKAMHNCYWMLKQPRFIYCIDKSKSARKILRLFSKCVKVWCSGASCSDVQDIIVKAGCDTVRDVDELPDFMSGEMCPK